MVVLLMQPTVLVLLCVELVPLVYCIYLLLSILYRIGANDSLLIVLPLLIIISIVMRFMYGLLWFINMTRGNRDYAGLYHTCRLNLTFYLPMLVIQIITSLINLAIWGCFITSVYYIGNKKFYLVVKSRKRILCWLVSLFVITIPLALLTLLSCYINSEVPYLLYLAVCCFVLMLCYIVLGRKLLFAL